MKGVKGLKPPSRKDDSTSPAKTDGASSLSVKDGTDKKEVGKAATTPEKSSEDAIPSLPFEPEMLPHLDMSTEEIGYRDV